MNHTLIVHLQQDAHPVATPAEFPPVRDTPLRIAIKHNAEVGTGGLHPVEINGLAIFVAATLTIAFASITCWLWWSRAGTKDHAAIGLARVGRKLGLTTAERAAVRTLAEAAQLEPAALLLSTSVFDRSLEHAPPAEADRDMLVSVRTKLDKAFNQAAA